MISLAENGKFKGFVAHAGVLNVISLIRNFATPQKVALFSNAEIIDGLFYSIRDSLAVGKLITDTLLELPTDDRAKVFSKINIAGIIGHEFFFEALESFSPQQKADALSQPKSISSLVDQKQKTKVWETLNHLDEPQQVQVMRVRFVPYALAGGELLSMISKINNDNKTTVLSGHSTLAALAQTFNLNEALKLIAQLTPQQQSTVFSSANAMEALKYDHNSRMSGMIKQLPPELQLSILSGLNNEYYLRECRLRQLVEIKTHASIPTTPVHQIIGTPPTSPPPRP